MNLCIQSVVKRRGYKGKSGNRQPNTRDTQPNMRGRAKLMLLLKAIEHSGREMLKVARVDVESAD